MLITKLKFEGVEALQKTIEHDVNEYCKNFETRPRLTKEKRMASLLSELSDLRIIFATSSMAEDMVDNALSGVSVLVFDEATQGSYVEIANLISRLPNLEKVLITGDQFQLGCHLQNLPKILHIGYGLESMVEQLLVSPLVRHTHLITCYRMHSILVNCVSFAAYEQHGQLLEPERNEERAMLTKSNFPLPVQSCC